MKFSIRDLLLVTVIVALAVGWWVDSSRLQVELRRERLSQLSRLNGGLRLAEAFLPDSSVPTPKLPKD